MSSAGQPSVFTCRACPRLVAHHQAVKQAFPDYHAAPVGAWGDPGARILLVGLAPGLHGATRTGKAFVGDASGAFLFAALHRCGLATHPQADKAALNNVRITNVVKCLPPRNAPGAQEISNCQPHLAAELAWFCPSRARLERVIVTLGAVAHRAVTRTLGLSAKQTPFVHAGEYQVSKKLQLISCFHPSRLNVNTGRITPQMIDQVLQKAINRVSLHTPSAQSSGVKGQSVPLAKQV